MAIQIAPQMVGAPEQRDAPHRESDQQAGQSGEQQLLSRPPDRLDCSLHLHDFPHLAWQYAGDVGVMQHMFGWPAGLTMILAAS